MGTLCLSQSEGSPWAFRVLPQLAQPVIVKQPEQAALEEPAIELQLQPVEPSLEEFILEEFVLVMRLIAKFIAPTQQELAIKLLLQQVRYPQPELLPYFMQLPMLEPAIKGPSKLELQEQQSDLLQAMVDLLFTYDYDDAQFFSFFLIFSLNYECYVCALYWTTNKHLLGHSRNN